MKRFKITIKSRPVYLTGKNRPVCVDIVIKNVSRYDYYIATVHTPLDSAPNTSLTLVKDGKALPYDGPRVKRVPGKLGGLCLLRAGKQKKVCVSLSDRYPLYASGLYRLSFKTRYLYCYRAGKNIAQGPRLDRCEVESLPPIRKSFYVVQTKESAPTCGDALRRLEADRVKLSLPGVEFPEPNIIFHNQGTGETEAEFRKKVKESHYEMIHYLEHCLTELEGFTDLPANDHYRLAFGAYDVARYDTVKQVCRTILDGLKKETVTYERNLDPDSEDPITLAWTTYNTRTVYLCPGFLHTRLTGEDSAAGTLFHEWTHAYKDTEDYEYGRNECMILAENNPGEAANNADSFELFLETRFLNWNHKADTGYWPGTENVKCTKAGGPSAVAFNGKMYLFYCGVDNKLWKAEYAEGAFKTPEPLKADGGEEILSDFHPEAISCNSRIYLFYLSSVKKNLCYLIMERNGTWLPEALAEDSHGNTFKPLYPPQPILFNNSICLVYKKDELGFCSTSLGLRDSDFGAEADIPDSGLIEEALYNPAPAVFNGQLYLIYGNKQDASHNILYATWDAEHHVWHMGHSLAQCSDLPNKATQSEIRSAADGDAVCLLTRFHGQGQIQANYNPYLKKVLWTDGEELQWNTFRGTQPESASLCSFVTLGEYNYLFGICPVTPRILYALQMRGQ